MNYNRRSTRPDGVFYREQRKLRGSSRGGGGGRVLGISPVKVIVVVVLLGVLLYFIFGFRH